MKSVAGLLLASVPSKRLNRMPPAIGNVALNKLVFYDQISRILAPITHQVREEAGR